MEKLFNLKGRIQNYAWGGKDFIPELLGIQKQDVPYAEYWLGAHANAPAIVLDGNSEIPLDQFIEKDPVLILGPKISDKFGRLPYLFKILDVHDMLSIQVHPTKEEAEKGFQTENERGIPLTAPNRNYKDDNHKPEIMLALGDFWLLHGFLPEQQLKDMLKKTVEFSGLSTIFEQRGYRGLYQHVMEMEPEESDKILKPLTERILPLFKKGKLSKKSPDYWAAKAIGSSEKKHLDKGIFSIYFFNVLKVTRGQAVFQDAGVPHAYLEGQNMELMANSDNVLRGGLTPKHIDVPELLKHVVFEATEPVIMDGAIGKNEVERIYLSPAPDFELSCIHLEKGQEFCFKTNTAEILMMTEGEAEITEGHISKSMKKGDSFLLTAGGNVKITTKGETNIFRATTP